MLTRSVVKAVRSFSTSAKRSGGGHGLENEPYKEPGHNLPFQIKNKYHLLLTFSLFFGSAAAFPFWFMKRAAEKNL